MNYELKKLPKWLRSNKISFNSGKSELFMYRSKAKKELGEKLTNLNFL